jgi:dihydrofolate reductase
MPSISIIVGRARNGVIGRGGDLPWRLPEDLAHFKRTTMGHPVIMGRKTWDSIVARLGKPLPGRRNIVVSRNGQRYEGAEVVPSLDAALALCAHSDEAFVIGGAQLYALALPRATRVYATEIDADFDGDAFFPALDPAVWREVRRERHHAKPPNDFDFDFVTYERV